MVHPKPISRALLVLVTVAFVPLATSAADLRLSHNALEARYTRAHSLGDNYQFYPRDGWQTVNISNLQYKYRREDAFSLDFEGDPDDSNELDDPGDLTKRDSKNSKSHSKVKTTSHVKSTPKPKSKAKATSNAKATSKTKTKTDSKSVTKSVSSLQQVVDTIKGVGNAEPVLITWYAPNALSQSSAAYHVSLQVHRPRFAKPELLGKSNLGSDGESYLFSILKLTHACSTG